MKNSTGSLRKGWNQSMVCKSMIFMVLSNVTLKNKIEIIVSMKGSLVTVLALITVSTLVMQCKKIKNIQREVRLSNSVPAVDQTREAKILTAFFGLDNALPGTSRVLYRKAPGKDGMPIVFSLEVEPNYP